MEIYKMNENLALNGEIFKKTTKNFKKNISAELVADSRLYDR